MKLFTALYVVKTVSITKVQATLGHKIEELKAGIINEEALMIFRNISITVLVTLLVVPTHLLSADEGFFSGLEKTEPGPQAPPEMDVPPEAPEDQRKVSFDQPGPEKQIYGCLLEDLQRQISTDYKYVDTGHWPKDSDAQNFSYRDLTRFHIKIKRNGKVNSFLPFNKCAQRVSQLPVKGYKKMVSDLEEILNHNSNAGILEELKELQDQQESWDSARFKKDNVTNVITFKQYREPWSKEMGIKHVLKALGKKAGADETAILDPEFSKLEESSDGAKTKASNWIISLKLLLNHSEKEKTGEVEAKPIRN